jgi:hypothetical protein
MARLQNQFGDMNISTFFNNESTQAELSDDESSLEEPTAEELARWQEAQFVKGRMEVEAKRMQKESTTTVDVHKAILQRRRNKSPHERSLLRECEENDWEKISSLPDLNGESSVFFPARQIDESGIQPLLHALAAADPEILSTRWKRLYSSSHGDGLSFRNLCERIRGYKGPTILMIGGEPSASKCVGSDTSSERIALGFFTTDYWIESPDSFGSDDCFLFSIDDTTNNLNILHPKSRSKDESTSMASLKPRTYLYCHPSSISKSKNPTTTVFGIGIGGTPAQPRLHLTESLEECRCLPYDALFQDGDLLHGKCDSTLYYFDVDTMEIWGVGGLDWINDALSAQIKERTMRESALEKARRVDKRQMLEHFENAVSTVGGGGLFGHQDFIDERDVDCRIGG